MLAADSNMIRFQRRWRLVGEGADGDADAVFFTFRRRGDDLTGLPRDTTLQRAIVDRLRGGGHWRVRQGVIPLDGPPADGAAEAPD